MTDHPSFLPGSFAEAWELDRRIEQFEQAWRVGPPEIDDFLSSQGCPTGTLLQELVHVDLEHRLRRGCTRPLEQYFAKYPLLGQDATAAIRLIVAEYALRKRLNLPAAVTDYLERFPHWRTQLEQQLHADEAAVERPAQVGWLCASCGQPLLRQEDYCSTPVACPACGATIRQDQARFRIRRRIGAGGMGIVYEALDVERQASVAMKLLPRCDPAALYRFKQEFRALADVRHPNLVRLHELVADGPHWFITMELISGVDFLTYVRGRATNPQRPRHDFPSSGTATLPNADDTWTGHELASLGEQDSNSIFFTGSCDYDRLRAGVGQLAQGLEALHQAGKLHRDLKPSNVLVQADGQVIILDFGLVLDQQLFLNARSSATSDSWTFQDPEPQVVGTVAYMAPEQAAGLPLTPASDWYAVGVMMFVALTGRLPFAGNRTEVLAAKQQQPAPSVSTLAPYAASDLAQLCDQLLVSDPALRPSGSEVLARLADSGPANIGTDEEPTPRHRLVGRADPQASLRQAYAALLEGKSVVVHLQGASGMGKSTLLASFLEEVRWGEAVVLAGRCYEQESVPYKALDSLIDALSHFLAGLHREKVDALLPRDIAALSRMFPVLQRIPLVLSAAAIDRQVQDLQELRRRAFEALREMLARLGARRPLVLAIDDLQWGDVEGVTRLVELLRPPDPPPCLLILSYRHDERHPFPVLAPLEALRTTTRDIRVWKITLGTLPSPEAVELATEMLRRQGIVDQHRAAQIAREAQGHPFFISELAQDVASTDLTAPDAESWLDLDEVLWRRIQRLPPAAVRCLEILAVAEQPLPCRNIFEAAQLATWDEGVMTSLRGGSFIRSHGRRLNDLIEPYHDRIRECVRAHLDRPTQQAHHANLARSLEKHGAADPETIAIHFRAAQLHEQAARYFELAAEEASRALAFERAAKLYRLVFELESPQGERRRRLQVGLGEALSNAGRGNQAAEAFRAAAVDAPAAVRLDLQRRAAYEYLISGHIESGQQAMQAVLRSVGMRLARTERGAWWSALLQQIQLQWRGFEFQAREETAIPAGDLQRLDICWAAATGIGLVDVVRAADLHARALRLSLKAGEPFRVLRSLALETIYLAAGGTRTQNMTARLLAATQRQALGFDHPYAPAIVDLAEAAVAYLHGRNQRAYFHALRAEEGFRSHCTGAAWEIDIANNYRFWSLVMIGQVQDLARTTPQVLQQAQERGDLFGVTNLAAYAMPHVYLWAQDDPQLAEASVDEALARWPQQGFLVQHLAALIARAEVHLYRGTATQAQRFIASQWGLYRRSQLTMVQQGYIEALFARGRVHVALAEASRDAAGWLSAAEHDARLLIRQRHPRAVALAQLLRAGIAACRGDQKAARLGLSVALAALETSDRLLYVALVRQQLGRLEGGSAGAERVQTAQTWLQQSGFRNPEAVAAALLPGFRST